jgi:YNFM family putative membrane transporter
MNGDTAARAAVPAPTPEAAPTSSLHIRQGTPEFRRASLALFASGFATFGLLYCVQPLLPEFSKDFGVGAAGSAMALSLSTGVLAVAMIFAGILSDRVGRRPVMAVSLLASSVLMLLVSLMHQWHAVLLLRTLLGLALSGVPAVAMTWLAEEMDAGSLGSAWACTSAATPWAA